MNDEEEYVIGFVCQKQYNQLGTLEPIESIKNDYLNLEHHRNGQKKKLGHYCWEGTHSRSNLKEEKRKDLAWKGCFKFAMNQRQ